MYFLPSYLATMSFYFFFRERVIFKDDRVIAIIHRSFLPCISFSFAYFCFFLWQALAPIF